MIELSDIQTAANRIQNHILATPLVFSQAFSQMFGGDIYLKMENLQKTGSFKARGAMNLILALRDQIPANGVVAASAGNHAQGVARAARMLGLRAVIVMPDDAPAIKVAGVRADEAENLVARLLLRNDLVEQVRPVE